MDETLYREVTESIKAVFDLTARVDERVKMMTERQVNLENRIDNTSKLQSDLVTKVGILEVRNGSELKELILKAEDKLSNLNKLIQNLELRMQMVEKSAKSTESKWKTIFDFVYKTIWVIIVCWILFKLNLQTPPLP